MSNVEAAEEEVSASTTNLKEWTKRLQAYTDWLNVQLKKQKSWRKVTDLKNDLQDGVVIAQLVETLGGGAIPGIDLNPASPTSRKENIERIFQHFSSKQVPIPNCRVKDVLAGDPKCLMRLIHAVASHFRPESVLNPPAVGSKTVVTAASSGSSTVASGAVKANAGDTGHHAHCTSLSYGATKDLPSKPKTASSLGRQRAQQGTTTPKKPSSGGSALPIRKQPLPSRDSPPKLPPASLPSISLDNRTPLRKSFTSLSGDRLSRRGIAVNSTVNTSASSGSSLSKEAPPKISCKVAPLQYSSKSTAEADVAELHSTPSLAKLNKKKSVVSRSEPSSLDSVDLKIASDPDEVKNSPKTCSCSALKGDVIAELLKDVQEAKNQILLLQDVLLHGNGGKFMKNPDFDVPYGSSEDVEPTSTTQQVLRECSPKESMNNCSPKRGRTSEPLSMVKKLISFVSVCGDRKRSDTMEVSKPKSVNDPPDVCRRNMKDENEALRKTIQEKDLEIRRLKMALTSQMQPFDKKLKYPYSLATQTQREELQVVHEALTSLRKCFPANDPYQHTLDTIEQSLSALLERVNSLEIGAVPAQTTPKTGDIVPGLARRTNYDTLNEGLRRTFPKPSGYSVQRQEDTRNSTKVVYYMDKSVTPFRCVLNKRIGEATLRDFKLLFDRPGQYRYHFKTLDPEFGMVKEEVLHDEDILPGWDGKIIAWIEEDCS